MRWTTAQRNLRVHLQSDKEYNPTILSHEQRISIHLYAVYTMTTYSIIIYSHVQINVNYIHACTVHALNLPSQMLKVYKENILELEDR